ncbi:hypothetical protein LUZ60_000968 [Juncus effusus]|nr:hypothetical protein LUZ60_000968 [Juncus effusus]
MLESREQEKREKKSMKRLFCLIILFYSYPSVLSNDHQSSRKNYVSVKNNSNQRKIRRSLASPSVLLSSNDEVNALIAVKEKLNDPNRVLRSWTWNSSSPCSWFSITCNNDSTVIRIDLGDSLLSGILASQIGQLKNLVHLELYGNNISGEIPKEIGNLTKLLSLDLHSNNFECQIPSTLGNLSSLQFLRLDNNKLSGPIPLSLTNLTALHVLDLSNNTLSGEVPSNGSFQFFSSLSFSNDPLLRGQIVKKPCNFSSISPPPPPNPQPIPPILSPSPSNKAKLHNTLLVVALVLLLFSSFGMVCCLLFRRKKRSQNSPEKYPSQIQRFSLQELQQTTNNFNTNSILGKGSSGKVYKGRLADGSSVAIKKLNREHFISGLKEFSNEVEMLSKVVHGNVLPLLGFCIERKECLLVYPYMANGSVSSCLREGSVSRSLLDWRARKRIALGTAKAIAYLHHTCDPKIIHCDIKAANILLDDSCQPFIGDFGVATIMNSMASGIIITSVRGTYGYIAPEYLSSGILSDKVDVFAYGITLLELVTGQGPYDLARLMEDEDLTLLDWVTDLVDRQQFEVLVDPDLRENYLNIEADVESVVQVAMLCTQQIPAERPTMLEVVRMLEDDEGIAKQWLEWQRRRREGTPIQEKDTYSLLKGFHYNKLVVDFSSRFSFMEMSNTR